MILFNVITNAAKYTRSNDSVTISCKLMKPNEIAILVSALKNNQNQDPASSDSPFNLRGPARRPSEMSLDNASFMTNRNLGSFNVSEQNEYLKISIVDTGIGMGEDVIKGLFKLFGNTKMQGNINQTGIGLGLTVSA